MSMKPEMSAEEWEKFKNKMLAHLDGVYRWSARDDCDFLVSVLIGLFIDAEKKVQRVRGRYWNIERMQNGRWVLWDRQPGFMEPVQTFDTAAEAEGYATAMDYFGANPEPGEAVPVDKMKVG